MLQKFKMITFTRLLSIGLFVLPFAGNVTEVAAESCDKGTKQEVRQCFKEIVKGFEVALEEAKADIRILKAEKDELHAARKKALEVVTKMIKDEQSTLQAAQKLEKHGVTFFDQIISDLRDAL